MNEMAEDKPPQSNMGFGSRIVSSLSSLVKRFKRIGELWGSDWSIPFIRNPIHGRCYAVLGDISQVRRTVVKI